MSNTEKNSQDAANKDAAVKPDEETLHTTDPQEHMEGPFSSVMQGVKEGFEENEEKDKEDEKEA